MNGLIRSGDRITTERRKRLLHPAQNQVKIVLFPTVCAFDNKHQISLASQVLIDIAAKPAVVGVLQYQGPTTLYPHTTTVNKTVAPSPITQIVGCAIKPGGDAVKIIQQ